MRGTDGGMERPNNLAHSALKYAPAEGAVAGTAGSAVGRCALCGRGGRPLSTSLSTPGPGGALRTVRACAPCAAAAPSYAALVRALLVCATGPGPEALGAGGDGGAAGVQRAAVEAGDYPVPVLEQ